MTLKQSNDINFAGGKWKCVSFHRHNLKKKIVAESMLHHIPVGMFICT